MVILVFMAHTRSLLYLKKAWGQMWGRIQ